MTPEFLTALKAADWRGNIRELRNVIERSMIICDKQLTLQDLPIEIQNSQQEELTSKIIQNLNWLLWKNITSLKFCNILKEIRLKPRVY